MNKTKRYKKVNDFICSLLDLEEVSIFDTHGALLSQSILQDNRVPEVISHFMQAVAESQIQTSFGDIYALTAGTSKHKIIIFYLSTHKLYFLLRGSENLNLSLIEIYLPEITKLIDKSANR